MTHPTRFNLTLVERKLDRILQANEILRSAAVLLPGPVLDFWERARGVNRRCHITQTKGQQRPSEDLRDWPSTAWPTTPTFPSQLSASLVNHLIHSLACIGRGNAHWGWGTETASFKAWFPHSEQQRTNFHVNVPVTAEMDASGSVPHTDGLKWSYCASSRVTARRRSMTKRYSIQHVDEPQAYKSPNCSFYPCKFKMHLSSLWNRWLHITCLSLYFETKVLYVSLWSKEKTQRMFE